MGQVNYRELGASGLAFDKDPAELPVGFFTGGTNALPHINGFINAPGFEDSGLLPGVEAEFLLAETNQGVNKIHVFGGQSSFIADATAAVNTSNIGGYSTPLQWTAVYHKEVTYANNGVDKLQYYNPVSGKFEDVPGFPATIRFQYIRKFKDYLIGIGVIESGNVNNEEVYWSHPTTIGSTPASWDVADAAYDAGRQVFPTARGKLLDALELQDTMMIYKSDSIWSLSYIGGNGIFRRQMVSASHGLLCHGAVTSFPGGHFFVGENGIYTFNGSSMPQEIATGRVRDKLFEELDSTNYEKLFLLTRNDTSEVWIYYPSVGSTYCNKALVWNWALDSWGYVDVGNVLHAVVSEDLTVADKVSWEDMGDATWESGGRWVEQLNRRFIPVVYEAQYSVAGIENLKYQTILGMREGALPVWSVERNDFLLGPFSARGNVIQDYETMKIISEVWIRMIANGTVYVTVGGRDNESDPVEWDDPVEFNPNVDTKLDVFITRRFHSLRIENKDCSAILLQGINVRWENGGEF